MDRRRLSLEQQFALTFEAAEHLMKARDALRRLSRDEEALRVHKILVFTKRRLRWLRPIMETYAFAGLPTPRERHGEEWYQRMVAMLAPRKRK